MREFVALKASAGSGKTYALTLRYVSLLFLGAKPNEILTLTFTNKAANEMKERIFEAIMNLGSDKDYLKQISLQCGLSIQDIEDKKTYIQSIFINGHLAILTIDKFINQILKEFSGYLGIFDSFEVKNDNLDELSFYFLESLNDEDFAHLIEIYLQENKKLNSLITLFKFFIQKESSMKIDLKVYEEDLQTIENKVFDLANDLKLHLLKIYGDSMGVNANKALEFSNFDELITKTWILRDSLQDYRDLKKYEDTYSASLFIKIKEQLKKYYTVRSNNSTIIFLTIFKKFKEFREQYIIKKRYLEFNDITNLANKLLGGVIDKDFLYFRLDARFKHILIDEFQDTSIEQFNILLPLIEESLGGNPEDFRTFFYVGDTKQSIYRFRGGKRELFDYLLNQYPQIDEENLDTNYRSKENIIEFVNDTFLKLSNYEYTKQKNISSGGYVEVITDSALGSDEPYSGVYEKILMLKENGVDLNKLAILVSTNEEVLNLYTYLMDKNIGISITTEMSSKLIKQNNVKALINIVKYLYFKEDLYKLFASSLLGIELDISWIDFDIDSITLQSLLKKVAFYYDIVDDNIIKLIELSGEFGDIFDFVYNIDFLDATMVNSSKVGVSILTIFKSKGLEYESVIVVDKLKKDSNITDAFLFEYDSVDLKQIHYKIKNKEYFDDSYANAIEKEEQQLRIDILNVLYVALTRAKNNMIIIKKDKNSIFEYLNLEDLKVGKLSTQFDNTPHQQPNKAFYQRLNIGLQDNKKASIKEEFSNIKAKYFGIATHFCLELAKEFSIDEIAVLIDLSKQRFLGYLNNNDFAQISKLLYKLFDNQIFQALIKDALFLNKEQPLLYNGELKYIDLLLLKNDTYYIIDYKTSKIHHDIYIKQVANYKKAVQAITGSNKIVGILIYLNQEEIEFYEVRM